MTWLLRAGRIVLVIAVIFFLAAGAALGKAAPGSVPGRDASRCRPALHFPADWVTTPVLLLKDAVLAQTEALRTGKSVVTALGVDVLTRAIHWVRDLGLARVESTERPSAGGV